MDFYSKVMSIYIRYLYQIYISINSPDFTLIKEQASSSY